MDCSVMVPPLIVKVPVPAVAELLMPPVTLSAPPSIWNNVVAALPSVSSVLSALPMFIVPALIRSDPPFSVTLKPLVVTVAPAFSQKPPFAGMLGSAVQGVILLVLECL